MELNWVGTHHFPVANWAGTRHFPVGGRQPALRYLAEIGAALLGLDNSASKAARPN